MGKAKFIEEMLNFLPEGLTVSQIKAVTQFCSNLFDNCSLVDMPNRLAKANERVKELESALEKETIRKNASFRHEELITEENKELRRQRFRTYDNEEYIIFFDDGEDYPESMAAPVVMSADKFKDLFYAREQLRKGGEKPDRCSHEWVSADNEVVKGISICTKCKFIVETEQLRKEQS
jgi:hypothetical protein